MRGIEQSYWGAPNQALAIFSPSLIWLLNQVHCALQSDTHCILFHIFWECVCVLSCFSCIWLLGGPMDCSPPGSSVHGILQPRILEWVAILQGIFPTPVIEPVSPALQADSLLLSHQERPFWEYRRLNWHDRDRRKWNTTTKMEHDSNLGVSQIVHVFVLGSIIQRNQPECVSNSVVEVDKIFVVNH